MSLDINYNDIVWQVEAVRNHVLQCPQEVIFRIQPPRNEK